MGARWKSRWGDPRECSACVLCAHTSMHRIGVRGMLARHVDRNWISDHEIRRGKASSHKENGLSCDGIGTRLDGWRFDGRSIQKQGGRRWCGWMEGLTGARAPEFGGIARSLRDRIDSVQIGFMIRARYTLPTLRTRTVYDCNWGLSPHSFYRIVFIRCSHVVRVDVSGYGRGRSKGGTRCRAP